MSKQLDEAIRALQEGSFILVCDAETREDEADLIMPAEFVDSSHVNFMINEGRGLICVPMSAARARRLNLPLMVKENEGSLETAFTISVDAILGTRSGISSRDRAQTIKLLSDDMATRADFAAPGHVFPLIAHPEGLKKRAGHTEASVYLMEQAGLKDVAVLCETLSAEGEPLKGDDLIAFSKKWSIPIISIEEIIENLKT